MECVVVMLAILVIALFGYMGWSNEEIKKLRNEQERLRCSLEKLYVHVCKGDKQ